MLDDLKYIHEKDAQDALGIAEKQWQQLQHNFDLGGWQSTAEEYSNVVFAGMGGSALAALLATSWPGIKVPFEITKHYELPSYVNERTLVIASSYSGNTEETLATLEAAEQKNAQIAVIASGGRLADIASEKKYPIAKLPAGMQPRFAALYGLKALVVILEAANLAAEGNAVKKLEESAATLKLAIESWRADVKTNTNDAKKLAQELAGATPVIYAGPKLFPAAYKWKISFNENSKNVAWCNQFPEFNHNEFLGWTSHPIDKPYKIIELLSNFEHDRNQKRFTVTNKLLSGRWPNPHLVEAKGDSLLDQMLYTVALGDFTSIYLALLNGLNPSPVDIIEKLKTELDN